MAPQHTEDTAVFKRLALAAVALMLAAGSQAADFYLDAASSRGHPRVVKRSNARSGMAVRLEAGESIQITFCLKQKTVIQVLNVLYSNDGRNETVAVVADESFLGTFTSRTQSDWGRLWNVFVASPPLARTLVLPSGWHTLRVGVLLPSDGVELDSVHVWFSDESLTRAMLDCLLLCKSSLPSVPLNTAPVWQKLRAKQASYPTRCAEEDNVKVPLYLSGIAEYSVTASMPTYVSFANRREANTTHCPNLPPLLWAFPALPPPPPRAAPSFNRAAMGATLFALRSSASRKQIFRIEFLLQGRSKGYVDAEMGSILTIRLDKSSGQFLLRTAYIGRSGSLTSVKNAVVAAGQTEHRLQLPDYVWKENGSNVLLLEVQSSVPVHVTEVKLERRPQLGEKIQTVHKSGGVVIEAVEVDFWWRRPETMELRNGETGQVWGKVDFFRLSLHVPWNGGFAQVLVMYQDGNVRLLPLPPPGVDWIPFGSSVIVGHSDPADLRPSAPITSVTFYPSTLRLHVRYHDGGSARLALSSSQTVTELVVSDIRNGGGGRGDAWRRLPFATLRSMYIEDGNSDCDSVLVDGKSYRPIMGQWGSLLGKSFFFFRRCESSHLTLSPDLRIDIRKTSYVLGGGGGGGVTSGSWWWQLYSQGHRQPLNPPYRPRVQPYAASTTSPP